MEHPVGLVGERTEMAGSCRHRARIGADSRHMASRTSDWPGTADNSDKIEADNTPVEDSRGSAPAVRAASAAGTRALQTTPSELQSRKRCDYNP